MKHIYLFITSVLFSTSLLYAQEKTIGINTEVPEQLLHIDGKGNTQSNNPESKTDDVVITKEGAVGIGITTVDSNLKLQIKGESNISNNLILTGSGLIDSIAITNRIGVGLSEGQIPKASLHINSIGENAKFRLSDTSEKVGHLLTSDDKGNAYWEALRPMSSVVRGSFIKGVNANPSPGNHHRANITKDSLNLVPGKWLILANSATTGSLGGFTMYMELYCDHGGNGIVGTGRIRMITTSSTAEITTNDKRANINLMYIAEVPIPKKNNKPVEPTDPNYITKYWIEITSSGLHGVSTGEGAFYAIRLDRHDN